jgi:Fic family protein
MLTCEKLKSFTLLEDAEKNIVEKDFAKLMLFFDLFQEITSLDQFIKDLPSYPGSTDKIKRSEMISAIGGTLAIEGTLLAKEDIEQSFQKADANIALQRKEQEAENSRAVYEFIIDFVTRNHKNGIIYSEALIRQIHKLFVDKMNYLSTVPGEYRSNFNVEFGTDRKKSLCRTQLEVDEAMINFIEWLNRPGSGPISKNEFAKAIMAHYYLTEIHPFGDGNGRTARAVEAMILLVAGRNNYCFWSLANFWSTNKEKYLTELNNIRGSLDPIEFVLWGLEGYKQELLKIKGKILIKVKRLMLRDYIQYLSSTRKTILPKKRINDRIVVFMNFLIKRGKVPLKQFYSEDANLIYKNKSESSRIRDMQKMLLIELVTITKENDIDYIIPNYQLLDDITYNV